jgi:hypothetical protein
MAKSIAKGDRVSWQSAQGLVKGRVLKKQTKATKIKAHKVSASKASPQYIVRSEKTGALAAHKAKALRKEGR